MNKRSLLNKTLTQFIVCIAVLLILTTPLFYLLTKYYYAEDMIDIIEAVKLGKPIPALDLEQDIMHGIMIQFRSFRYCHCLYGSLYFQTFVETL